LSKFASFCVLTDSTFADNGESARWGLVFRVLEQQQQAIQALQQLLKSKQ
jgi:hypothetical protein